MSDAWVDMNTESAWADLSHDELDDTRLNWLMPFFEVFVPLSQDDIQRAFSAYVPLLLEESKQVGYTPHRRCTRMPPGARTSWIGASVRHQTGVRVNWIGTSTRPMGRTLET